MHDRPNRFLLVVNGSVRDDQQHQVLVALGLDGPRNTTHHSHIPHPPRRLAQHAREVRRTGEPQCGDHLVVHRHDARHARHLGVGLVEVQGEAVIGRQIARQACTESVHGEQPIGVVKLNHVADHRDGALISTPQAEKSCALIQLALCVESGVDVMKRVGRGGVAIAAREVDRHHEVEFQTLLYELQERCLLHEAALLHVQRSSPHSTSLPPTPWPSRRSGSGSAPPRPAARSPSSSPRRTTRGFRAACTGTPAGRGAGSIREWGVSPSHSRSCTGSTRRRRFDARRRWRRLPCGRQEQNRSSRYRVGLSRRRRGWRI